MGLSNCIFSKFPEDGDTPGPGTILWLEYNDYGLKVFYFARLPLSRSTIQEHVLLKFLFLFFVCGCWCFWVASVFTCKSTYEAKRTPHCVIPWVLRSLAGLSAFSILVLCLLYIKCPGCLVVFNRRNREKWNKYIYSAFPEMEASGTPCENQYIRWPLTSLPALHSIITLLQSVSMNYQTHDKAHTEQHRAEMGLALWASLYLPFFLISNQLALPHVRSETPQLPKFTYHTCASHTSK